MFWLRFCLHGLCHLLNRLSLVLLLVVLLPYAGLFWLTAAPERLGGALSLVLGQPVSVEAARLRWHRGQPVLAVQQLTLYAPQRTPALVLAKAELALSWRWLLGGAASRAQLQLQGLHLRLRRVPDGQWRVEGLTPAGPLDWAQVWENWLGREARLQLRDATLELQDASGHYAGPSPLRLDAELAQQADKAHVLRFQVRAPGAGWLTGYAHWQGNPFASTPPTVESYFQLEAAAQPLAALTQTHLGLTPVAGRLSLQAWLNSAGFQPRQLIAQGGLTDLTWQEIPATWHLQWKQLVWQAGMSGYLQELVLRQGEALALALPQLQFQADAQTPWRLRVQQAELHMGALAQLVRRTPHLTAKFQHYLREAEPDGRLHELNLAYDHGVQPRWRLRGWGDGLSAMAWQQAPGLAGLRGTFWATEQGGQLQLASPALSVDLPHLFTQPLAAQLQGNIGWWPDGGDWHVQGSELHVANADLAAQARFDLTLFSEAASPHLDLAVTLTRGRAEAVTRYVPVHITNPGLVAWLERAALSGAITHGAVLLQGPLADFPYDTHPTGQFQAQLQVQGAGLTYHPRYPRLHDLEATLNFEARALRIALIRGQTLDAQLGPVQVSIAELRKTGVLEVTGTATGTLATGLEFLRTSPLRERLGSYLDGLEATGPLNLQLALQMPFLAIEEVVVDGRLHLTQARLNWQGQPLEQVQGLLRFNAHGVEARDVQAIFQDWPMRLTLETLQGQTRITAQGPLTAQRLRVLLGLPPDWPGLAGSARWQGTLLLSGQPGQAPRLEARTDLQGLAVALPQPLTKPAAVSEDVRLLSELQAGGTWDLRYGDKLRLRWRLVTANQPMALAVQWGDTPPELPDQGVRLRGQWPDLDLNAWLDWFPDSGTPGARPAWDVRLRLAAVRWADQQFANVNVQTDSTGNWHVQSPDVALELQPPSYAEEPWRVRIQRLQLQASPVPALYPVPPAPPLSAARWPALELDCAELRYDTHLLGKLILAGQPTPAGWTLYKLHLEQPRWVLQGEGDWQASGWDLTLRLRATDMGSLLREWLETQALEAAEGQLALQLRAVPAPLDWRYWHGTAALQLRQGSLAEVEPGVAGRLLGLAGWQSLQRRLTLDFTDLFGKGLRFDNLTAEAVLADGQLRLQPLALEGTAARIAAQGRVGLRDQDYQVRVVVTPKATATLPLTGALTAGPAVGAALLLAQQLLGSEVDKLVRYEYAITGTWTDPQVQPVAEPVLESGPAATPAH